MGFDPQHQPQWDVFDYDKEVTIIDQMSQQASTKKVYVLVNVQEDEFDKSKNYHPDMLVVLKGAETDPSKGSAQFQIATETVYEGSYRGTIKDDVIGIADKKQMDEIFVKVVMM